MDLRYSVISKYFTDVTNVSDCDEYLISEYLKYSSYLTLGELNILFTSRLNLLGVDSFTRRDFESQMRHAFNSLYNFNELICLDKINMKIKIGEVYFGKIKKGLNNDVLIIEKPTDYKTESLLLMGDDCHVEFDWVKGNQRGNIGGMLTQLYSGDFHLDVKIFTWFEERQISLTDFKL